MNKSPVKFVGGMARAVSGGGGGRNNSAIDRFISESSIGKMFPGIIKKRQSKAELAQARIDSKKYKSLTFTDRMRALGKSRSIASQASPQVVDPAPIVENNSIQNTVAAAQDRSQMRDAGELNSVAGPAGFSTMSSAVLDPISRQPIVEDQLVTPTSAAGLQPQVPTYGVAGAAETMFGTPMQRQMSMGSSLMKRACKYKNKK